MRRAQVSIFIIVALLIVFSIVLIFTIKKNPIEKDRNDENIAECSSDNDCLIVQTSCCSCAMGGEEVCVAREKAELYEISQEDCPADLACIALYNCREESCGCVSGKCVWKDY